MVLPPVTCQEKRDFHNIDRQVYFRLVTEFRLSLSTSQRIVAFWFWIEREGSRDFIMRLVSLVTPKLGSLAMEAKICINIIYSVTSVSFDGFNTDAPLTRYLVGQDFSLESIYERREKAKIVIERFIEEVCQDVFSDIFPEYMASKVRIEEFVPYKEESDKSYSPTSDEMRKNWDLDSRNDRTLFITFSKGHPISRPELRNLITRRYGDCVEAIYMRERPPPLFARVILKSASATTKILGGGDLVKLHVDGKHAWVRRFIKK